MKHLAAWVSHALLVLVVAGLAGCGVGSVSPLVSETAITYDAKLVGAWQDSSASESVVITQVSPDRYSLVYTDSQGKVGRFKGVLGQAGPLRILDLEPEELPRDLSDMYKSLLLPLHGAVFIDSVDPTLRFRLLDADSLKRYLDQQPRAVAHVMRDEVVVLIAPTAELQRFLLTYVRRNGALGKSNVMMRRSP